FLSGTQQVGTPSSWPTTVDLLGPAPPTGVNLGAGGRLLKLGWDANTDPDVLGYKVFCENLGSTSTGITTYDAATLPESSVRTTCPDAGSGTDTTDDGGDAGDASDEAGGAA